MNDAARPFNCFPVMGRLYSFVWNELVGRCRLGLPVYIDEVLKSFGFDKLLPPFEVVMNEINLERFSIRSEAWIGERRRFIDCAYQSSLLSDIELMWNRGDFEGDARISGDSIGYIDPRLAVYYSMMIVDVGRWRELVRGASEIAVDEAMESDAGKTAWPSVQNDFTKQQLLNVIEKRLILAGFEFYKSKDGGVRDINAVLLASASGEILRGVFSVGYSMGRAVVDMSIAAERVEGGVKYISVQPLRTLLMPYASFYLNKFEDTRRMLFGVDISIRIFKGIRDFVVINS